VKDKASFRGPLGSVLRPAPRGSYNLSYSEGALGSLRRRFAGSPSESGQNGLLLGACSGFSDTLLEPQRQTHACAPKVELLVHEDLGCDVANQREILQRLKMTHITPDANVPGEIAVDARPEDVPQ
jgi:hypothetical protein